MYCTKCGKKIQEGSKFCPYCGVKQVVIPSDGHSDNPHDKGSYQMGSRNNNNGYPYNRYSAGSRIDHKIDQAGEEIEEGFGEALNDIAGGFRRDRHGSQSDQRQDSTGFYGGGADGTGDGGGSVGDYFTPKNIEAFAAISHFFPILMYIVPALVGGILIFFFSILLTLLSADVDLSIIRLILRGIFVGMAALGVVAAIYTVIGDKRKQTLWGVITVISTGLSFIACLGCMIGWPLQVNLILGILCFVWGLDVLSRVMIQKTGIESTPDLLEDFRAYGTAYSAYKRAHASESQEEQRRIMQDPHASWFDGTGLTLLGKILLTLLLSVITCGIYTPWGICSIYRWQIQHTVIGGHRLKFNGTGGSLLGHYILWEILTVITCGIFSFFMYVAVQRWLLRHTYYAQERGAADSDFDGNSFQFFGYSLLGGLLITVTFCIAFPWVYNMIIKWKTRHEIINGDRLYYDGTALGMFLRAFLVAVLTIVTLGIFLPWGICWLNRYTYAHTYIDPKDSHYRYGYGNNNAGYSGIGKNY